MRGASREALAVGTGRIDELLDAAPEAAERAAIGDELLAVLAVLDHEPGLRRALSDPSAAPERKQALVRQLFGDRVGASVTDLLGVLASQRWSRQRDLADTVWQLAVLAIVAAAEAGGRLDDVEDELFRFARVVEGERALHAAFTDPLLPAERKRAVAQALLEGKASPETIRLVADVVGNPRGLTLEEGLAEVGRIAARRRERLVALVRVAAPLTPQQHERFATVLGRIYGRTIQLNVEVDPAVVGGAVVRVGDDVIDGSVSARLADARQRIAE